MQDRSRRRILVLAPRNPYPTIGGDRLRIHRLARELAKRHDLTLLTLCTSKRELSEPLPDDGVFKAVRRILLPPWRSWLNSLAALPSSRPLQVAYYESSAFRDSVRELAPAHDAVLAHLIRTADYVRDLPSPRILEMTDAISMSMERAARCRSDFFDIRRHLYRIEARRLVAYEREVARSFHLISLTSAVDAAHLARQAVWGSGATSKHIVVPNGADIPVQEPPAQAERAGYELAFVGNLHSLQNFDGAWFFACHVWPEIRRRFPQAVLRIIGPIRSLAARRLRAIPGVCVEGVVPRLSEALASARIGICPVRITAGIQNKILDYFANRMAVVASPNSIEAIQARDEEHLLVAGTAQEWVHQVCRLFEDVALSQRLADAGRQLALERHSWEKCVQPMLAHLDRLLSSAEKEAIPPAAAVASFA